jgi:hypothetical protein
VPSKREIAHGDEPERDHRHEEEREPEAQHADRRHRRDGQGARQGEHAQRERDPLPGRKARPGALTRKSPGEPVDRVASDPIAEMAQHGAAHGLGRGEREPARVKARQHVA